MTRPLILNKSLSEYCKNSTNNSIRRLTEKYNLERNKPKIQFLLNDSDSDDDDKPIINFYDLIIFLSISTIAFLFYKRIK
jgi:hypothetical protein